jgi:7-carboxy-7-deazaguanine synthase
MANESASLRPADPHLALPASERIKVNEIFYSIQGESTAAGRPCVLVRLTGCQMRCVWCDSEYAFYEGEWMSLEEVLEKVAINGCPLVEVTGGEPLLQPGTAPLLRKLCEAGYEVLLETGGGLDISDVDTRVRRIVDLKCPGSGEVDNNRWENLEVLTPRDEVKFVVADRDDYQWTKRMIGEHRLADVCPLSVAPVEGQVEARQLAVWILEDRLPVRLNLQIHKVLWGSEARGV